MGKFSVASPGIPNKTREERLKTHTDKQRIGHSCRERKQGVNSSSVTTTAQLQTHNSLLFGGRIWLWDHRHGRLQVRRKRSD